MQSHLVQVGLTIASVGSLLAVPSLPRSLGWVGFSGAIGASLTAIIRSPKAISLSGRRRALDEMDKELWTSELSYQVAAREAFLERRYLPDFGECDRVPSLPYAPGHSPLLPLPGTPSGIELPLLPIDELLGHPAILLYGAQGSGKTSLGMYLAHRRQLQGHSLSVIDPHAECGQYGEIPVTGDGMDFEAINEALGEFSDRVKSRYGERSNRRGVQFSPETLLIDEFTSWSSRCKRSGEFFVSALSDTRKVGMHVIFMSHDRTLVATGGAKGFSGMRDRGLIEIEMMGAKCPQTKRPIPAGWCKVKFPGMDPIAYSTSPEMDGSRLFLAVQNPVQISSNSESVQRHESTLESLNRLFSMPSATSHPVDSVQFNPPVQMSSRQFELIQGISELRQKGIKSKNKILSILWGVSPGGTTAYKEASEEYDRLFEFLRE